MPSSVVQCTRLHFSLIRHLGLLLVSLVAVTQAACRFPEAWSGHWFQSGVRQIIVIDKGLLSIKGGCVDAEGDKFLIEDRRERCFRCVVIHEKHPNVLQYKETYCDPRDTLEDTCSRINGDAPLYTMFRVNATPETCPFGGPFTFTYNRGHGECRYPMSSVDSCTEDYRLLFRYQACPDVPGTESTAEELVCLATWKEGSTRFLVGKLEHKMASTSEDKYRCFIYEELEDETGFQVAQSGDATCIGLSSSNEGSRTMKLTRANPPYSSCEFPDWMTNYPIWHTLDRLKLYLFDLSTNATFNVTDADAITPHTQMACVEINPYKEIRGVVMVLHATIGCHSGYICARFYKRKEHVIEFQKGSLVHHFEDACHRQHFDEQTAEFVTLLTSSPQPGKCPRLGKYNILGMQQRMPTPPSHILLSPPPVAIPQDPCKAATEVHVGCNGHDRIEFHADCPVQQEPQTYQCHGSWQENGTFYLITSLMGTKSRFCFIYVETDNVVKISGVQETCSRRIQPGITGFMALNVSNEGDCGDVNGSIKSSLKTSSLFLISIVLILLLEWIVKNHLR